MVSSRRQSIVVCTFAALSIVACADGGAGPGSVTAGGHVVIDVAPLTLPGVTDACYTLTVFNGDDPASNDVVVVEAVCADRFGDGRGAISYLAPCDADGPGGQRSATVRLVLDDLCSGGACDPSGPGATSLDDAAYVNPCPGPDGCTLPATCSANADTPVTFSLTILRSANQGFFDVAVEFDDIFCAAKFDCRDEDGDPLVLLHDANGERAETAVLAFACTGGGEADSTHLYLSDVDVTCGGATATIDPSAGPGNLPAGAITGDAGGFVTGAATYRGAEQLGYAKRYWNLAIRLDLDAAAGGGASFGPSMDLISRGTSGSDFYYDAVATPNGRWVAFDTNRALVAADTDADFDVYLYDRLADTLVLASVDSAGQNDTVACLAPDLSDDGQRVVFWCNDTALAPGDTNNAPDVFLHDRGDGTTQRITDAAAGGPSVNGAATPFISGDGAFVVYVSVGTDHFAGAPASGSYLVRHEVATGARVHIDTAPGATQSPSAESEDTVGLSYDGDVVVFASGQSDLVAGDTNGQRDIFRKVVSANTIERVSVSTGGGQSNGQSLNPALSGDGTRVAFGSYASNLVAGDTNGVPDIFLHDTATGTTTRVSLTQGGAQASGLWPIAVSDNGAYVVFRSDAALDPADANGAGDLYRYDVGADSVSLVTATTTGTGAGFSAGYVELTSVGNAGQVAFVSSSGGLVDPALAPNLRGVWVADPSTGGVAPLECRLTAQATASDGALTGGATPDGVYPYIAWDVPLTGADGSLSCGRHAVNDGGGEVETRYTPADVPVSFAHCDAATTCP